MSDPKAFIVANLADRLAAPISDPWVKMGTLKKLDASKNRLFLKANRLFCDWGMRGIDDSGAAGIFRRDERLKALSAAGDPLERLAKVVDFELFRGEPEAALSRSGALASRARLRRPEMPARPRRAYRRAGPCPG
jgi:hypothetical protein